jgi:imidazole glycerol-phosphate synthase subunit HisH
VPSVTVVDYGIGNLLSVSRALEKCGAEVIFAHSAQAILSAERLVLPGVGAFADGMAGLQSRSLVEPLRTFAAAGRPLLGICLGMQMLMSRSEEFGLSDGLGIIEGNVIAIPRTTLDGRPHKIPFIGWNQLSLPKNMESWDGSILQAIRPGESVYLVHSYTAVPNDPAHRLADCDYDGHLISAAVRSGNVFGCQFHPEKSGPVGLRVVEEFIRI